MVETHPVPRTPLILTYAEAALIGSAIITPTAYTTGDPGQPGDVHAMAAVGINKRSAVEGETYRAVIAQWPWLETEREGLLPCGCNPRSKSVGYGVRAIDRITHLWDFHVIGDRTWTLEQLLAHIDTTYEDGRAWFALPHPRPVATYACGCSYPSSQNQCFAENCAICHIWNWTRPRKQVANG